MMNTNNYLRLKINYKTYCPINKIFFYSSHTDISCKNTEEEIIKYLSIYPKRSIVITYDHTKVKKDHPNATCFVDINLNNKNEYNKNFEELMNKQKITINISNSKQMLIEIENNLKKNILMHSSSSHSLIDIDDTINSFINHESENNYTLSRPKLLPRNTYATYR